jgi:hypothetical protein
MMTPGDLFVVEAVNRQLQRPSLTLALDVESRMVADFHLGLENLPTKPAALTVRHCQRPAGLRIKAESHIGRCLGYRRCPHCKWPGVSPTAVGSRKLGAGR